MGRNGGEGVMEGGEEVMERGNDKKVRRKEGEQEICTGREESMIEGAVSEEERWKL